MTVMQQLAQKSNVLGRKRTIPSRQTPSIQYMIKLLSGVNIFFFYHRFVWEEVYADAVMLMPNLLVLKCRLEL